MRITNKMMSGNSLANINTNKEYLDKLNNQMATEKKITRPSDDPIIAIRALRLRSNLSELTQYYGANVPDAQAWVNVTQSAIMSTKEMLSSLKAYADQGANGTNTASDRQKIYENMQALQKQIYLNGNATNAGRSVFTGYRTGESLTFTADTVADYRGISDGFNASDVTRNTYVEGAPTLDQISKLDPATGDETTVKEDRVNRIRLSYDNIDRNVKVTALGRYAGDEVGTISGWGGSTDWEKYWQNGKLTSEGEGFSSNITVDGQSITLKWDPKGDQTLLASPELDGVYDYIGRFKEGPESNHYGGIARDGNVYATRLKDETKVIYRKELDSGKVPSIPADSREIHPVDGLQKFEIDYNGHTYFIKKLEDGKFWAVADPNDTTALMDIDVANNTDGTLTVKVPTDGKDWNNAMEWNVFNISADARSVTSYYHESIIKAKIVTSDETVAKDSTGKGFTAYEFLALDPDNKNSDKGYVRTDEETITDPTKRTSPADSVYLLADTGELVFGSNIANTLSTLKDIPGVDTISVIYDKSNYEKGDLRPEHYFNVTGMDDSHTVFDPIIYDDAHQAITYTVGTNQSVKINTNADEVFDTQIGREIDDVLTAIEEYNHEEEKVNKLKAMQEDSSSYSETQMQKIKEMLDAANKGLDIAKNKLQRTYEEAISQFGKFFDQANLAETACGTVDNRLTLVSNRLSEEKTTVTTLASDNENVDITNIAVEVSEANLVYNAALMATGRISQQTLVDYI